MHASSRVRFQGKLVAFEGIDCAGKSAVISRLPELLRDCAVRLITCGELQSPISKTLRSMLPRASPLMKTFMFATDRAWTYEKVCLPALQRSDLVLWDRYVDSAIVYRAVEFAYRPQMIDLDFVRRINSIFPIPDLTIYIDIDVQTSQARAAASGRVEPYNPEFLERVRREYKKELEKKNSRQIDGTPSLETVAMRAAEVVRASFKEIFNGS